MRANTEGCTEWSCPYHGADNRYKSTHHLDCPVHNYAGAVIHLNGTLLMFVRDMCECGEANTEGAGNPEYDGYPHAPYST